jgi:hypothetical protein
MAAKSVVVRGKIRRSPLLYWERYRHSHHCGDAARSNQSNDSFSAASRLECSRRFETAAHEHCRNPYLPGSKCNCDRRPQPQMPIRRAPEKSDPLQRQFRKWPEHDPQPAESRSTRTLRKRSLARAKVVMAHRQSTSTASTEPIRDRGPTTAARFCARANQEPGSQMASRFQRP